MNPSTRAKAEEVASTLTTAFIRNNVGASHPREIKWTELSERIHEALIAFSDSQNRELREALKPFAKCASHHWVRSLTHGPVWTLGSTIEEPHRYEQITADDLRKAAALLSQPDGKETK